MPGLCTGQTGFLDFAKGNYLTVRLLVVFGLGNKILIKYGGFWYYENIIDKY